VLYLERGGRTVLSFTSDDASLGPAAATLVATVRTGRLGRLTLQRGDGAPLLGGSGPRTPLVQALLDAGFAPTPRGYRLPGQA